MPSDNPEFRKFTLENGLTLVVERHPRVRSVSIGAWVRIGSRYETQKESGFSHFVEHMVFKGTANRSSLEIATALERLGGDLNAFTDKEYTCFHSTVLAEHLEIALDVLSDLVIRPTFRRSELEREKKILLQELSLIEDSPDDNLLDRFLQTVWRGDSLGQPVIGSRANILAATPGRLRGFFDQHYRPDNVVLSVAGRVEFDEVRRLAEAYFKFAPVQKPIPAEHVRPEFQARRRHLAANTDQTHWLLGFEGLGFRDSGRFELLVLSFFLGGGMSSRLFQEIREKAALAYHVDCDCISFSDTGVFSVYLSTSPRSLRRCAEIVAREVSRLIESPLDSAALEMVKGQLKGAVLLASDEMESRQESIGRNELVFGRYLPVEEIVGEIDRVTPESVLSVARSVFQPKKETVVTLGRSRPKGNLSVFG